MAACRREHSGCGLCGIAPPCRGGSACHQHTFDGESRRSGKYPRTRWQSRMSWAFLAWCWQICHLRRCPSHLLRTNGRNPCKLPASAVSALSSRATPLTCLMLRPGPPQRLRPSCVKRGGFEDVQALACRAIGRENPSGWDIEIRHSPRGKAVLLGEKWVLTGALHEDHLALSDGDLEVRLTRATGMLRLVLRSEMKTVGSGVCRTVFPQGRSVSSQRFGRK